MTETTYRTYFDKDTGEYLGSFNYPPTPEQTDHPGRAGHPWKDGQVGSRGHTLDVATGTLIQKPAPPKPLSEMEKLVAWAKTMGYKP